MSERDWNDAYRDDPEAPKRAGDNARRWTPRDEKKANGADGGGKPEQNTNGEDDSSFHLICLADVEPTPVSWLWEGYLALGKLAVIGGDPELGKSQISNDVAARLSKQGAHWPLGPRAPMGASIFICSEDGIADTVRPRCEAAGADLNLVHVLKSTFVKNGKRKIFNLADDLDTLGNAIKQVGNVKFVCIDAITSYMGKIDSHRTTDVRGVLEPVADFAETYDVSILGVTHPPKSAQGNALRAFTGSFAFVAAPRLAHFVTKEPETDRSLLLPVKNNLGPKARGIGYRIGTEKITNGIIAPHILWDDAPVDFSADQAIAANNAAIKDGGAMGQAKAFLEELLANGSVDATEGREAAKAHGISEATLRRARADLRVKTTKTGFKSGWEWTLP